MNEGKKEGDRARERGELLGTKRRKKVVDEWEKKGGERQWSTQKKGNRRPKCANGRGGEEGKSVLGPKIPGRRKKVGGHALTTPKETAPLPWATTKRGEGKSHVPHSSSEAFRGRKKRNGLRDQPVK